MIQSVTTLWVVLGVVTTGMLALLLPPLLRRRGQDDHVYDAAIYRDQLAEVKRDHARELLGDDEAEAALREIQRRLLAADEMARSRPNTVAPPRRILAVVLALLLPALAVPIYLQLGSPGVPDQPLSARVPATPNDSNDAVAALATRLAEEPGDALGWVQLGFELMRVNRFDDAVGALERAMGLTDRHPGVATLYGEALVLAADGFVTESARAAFNTVLAANPQDPRARYYMALGGYQSGRREQALDDWLELAAESPADAPWMPEVEARVRNAAVELGRDPDVLWAALPPRAERRGPTAEDVAAMQQLTPEERSARIGSMVAGLEARLADEPDDLEGWRMLGRSQQNLGDPAAAAAAFAQASGLAPERVDLLLDWSMALVAAAGGDVTPEGLVLFERILAVEPENTDALWMSGVAALQAGDRDVALDRWHHALSLLPVDSREGRVVQQAISSVTRQSAAP